MKKGWRSDECGDESSAAAALLRRQQQQRQQQFKHEDDWSASIANGWRR